MENKKDTIRDWWRFYKTKTIYEIQHSTCVYLVVLVLLKFKESSSLIIGVRSAVMPVAQMVQLVTSKPSDVGT